MKFLIQHTLLCIAIAASGQFVPAVAYGQGTGHGTSRMESAQGRNPVNKGADGIAVKGYDVVAYFEQKKPMKGDPKYSYEYNGAQYRFISAAHRELFAKNPEAYLPQYGGYCAVGASMGHKADIEPESWAVIDGKLYLNSSNGAQKLFMKDPQSAIKQADQNWVKLE